MTLGHRVAVLNDGRCSSAGRRASCTTGRRTRFVAGFIGSPAMNLCHVRVRRTARSRSAASRVDGKPRRRAERRSDARARPAPGVARGRRRTASAARSRSSRSSAPTRSSSASREIGGEETKLVARAEARHAPARGERVSLRRGPDEAHLFDAGDRRAARCLRRFSRRSASSPRRSGGSSTRAPRWKRLSTRSPSAACRRWRLSDAACVLLVRAAYGRGRGRPCQDLDLPLPRLPAAHRERVRDAGALAPGAGAD